MTETRIADIRIGKRHRKDFGDIETLAASMKDIGLLHAIGITSSKTLVFGQRRLMAAKQLGWTKIETKTVDLKRIVDGEYAENELRKDFTLSERHEIEKEIRPTLPSKQGQRTDVKTNGKATSAQLGRSSEPPRDQSYKQAGFSSDNEAARVATVVKTGNAELIDLMDSGDVSVSAAAEVATLPTRDVAAIVSKGPAAVKAMARMIREQGKTKESVQISDTLYAILKDISSRLSGIREQYGTMGQMLESDLWKKCDATSVAYALSMLRAVSDTLSTMVKELEDYDGKKGRTKGRNARSVRGTKKASSGKRRRAVRARSG